MKKRRFSTEGAQGLAKRIYESVNADLATSDTRNEKRRKFRTHKKEEEK